MLYEVRISCYYRQKTKYDWGSRDVGLLLTLAQDFVVDSLAELYYIV
jgi:hypothetical protein